MSFVLVVRMKAKPAREGRAVELMPELAEGDQGRARVELYIPCRDPEDPTSFLFFEQYRHRAAFEEHGTSPFPTARGPRLLGPRSRASALIRDALATVHVDRDGPV